MFLGAFYYSNKESFVDGPITSQDTDIQIQACPSGTNLYSESGNILCCRGDIVDGTCNGITVCSTSMDKPTMPSCATLLRQEFQEKAVRFCPPTLPKYFEDPSKKIMGCTNGKRTSDGKGPLDPIQQTCNIYQSYTENLNKIDSCANIKQRDETKCPGGGKATLINTRSDTPALVQCSFASNTTPQPITCYGDKSALDYLSVAWPNWKGSLPNESKLMFCSTAEKYYINRSITSEELSLLDGPYKDVPKVKDCIFDARMYADNYPSLKKAFGYNEAKLIAHYKEKGLRAGLEYKKGCKFDPLVYADLNPDLKRIFKTNRQSLTNHFLMSGIKEKRVFRKL